MSAVPSIPGMMAMGRSTYALCQERREQLQHAVCGMWFAGGTRVMVHRTDPKAYYRHLVRAGWLPWLNRSCPHSDPTGNQRNQIPPIHRNARSLNSLAAFVMRERPAFHDFAAPTKSRLRTPKAGSMASQSITIRHARDCVFQQ